MELGTLPNPNRMYVDPRTYNSVNHAIEQNSVKEIPPKEIINLQEIGVGECTKSNYSHYIFSCLSQKEYFPYILSMKYNNALYIVYLHVLFWP